MNERDIPHRTVLDRNPPERYDQPSGNDFHLSFAIMPWAIKLDGTIEEEFIRLTNERMQHGLGAEIVKQLPRQRWAMIQVREHWPSREALQAFAGGNSHMAWSYPELAGGHPVVKYSLKIGSVQEERIDFAPTKLATMGELPTQAMHVPDPTWQNLVDHWKRQTGRWLRKYTLARNEAITNGHIVAFVLTMALAILTVVLL